MSSRRVEARISGEGESIVVLVCGAGRRMLKTD
jgi:hypothetical protein